MIESVTDEEGNHFKISSALNYAAPEYYDFTDRIDDISINLGNTTNVQQMKDLSEHRRELGLNTTFYTYTGDYPSNFTISDPGDNYWDVWYTMTLGTDGYMRWAWDNFVYDMHGDITYRYWEPGDGWFFYPLEREEADMSETVGFYSTPRYELFKQGVRDVAKAKYLLASEDVSEEQKEALRATVENLQRPAGTTSYGSRVPANEEQRMLVHSETQRALEATNALAREIAGSASEEEGASEASIQALQTMVNKAIALGSEDEALNAAIEAAQAVLAKEAPTATEVVTALLDLSEAMANLNTDESTDKLREDLKATIDFINENILSDVEGLRPGKVQELKTAIAEAYQVYLNENATDDEIKTSIRTLTEKAQELWLIVSKAELNTLIEEAEAIEADGYTEMTYRALQAAITAAKTVAANDDATTADVTTAIVDLANAIAGLEKITLDTSALEHEIELVSEMVANIDDYIAISVEGLADKLADAQNVLENATSQTEIDEAVKSLREARLNARTKADTSALEEIIAYANSLDLSGYSRASVAALNQAIAQNKLLLSDPEASQDAVDDAVTEIQNVIDALEPVSETAGSTTADSTNTAAASTMGMMAALMAAAGAASVMAYRRKRS